MDDFENTFFNLPSSTQYPLCSSSANNNSNVTTSSLNFVENKTDSNNLLQTQADDLDSMLLPCSTSSNQVEFNHGDDELATLLDSLPDEPLINEAEAAESPSLDAIIGQVLTSETETKTNKSLDHSQANILEQSVPKTNVVIKSETVPSNIMQLKLIKPVNLSSVSIGSATKVVPITVHSLSGQKHSIVRTVMPIGTPCVRVLSANNLPILKPTIIKQEPPDETVSVWQENDEIHFLFYKNNFIRT